MVLKILVAGVIGYPAKKNLQKGVVEKMAYSLGIDAGGTYTDSILIRNSDGAVIGSNKALTSYPDPLEGIRNSIDGLDREQLKEVTLVSVSTTLATNTLLERRGAASGTDVGGGCWPSFEAR